MFPGHPNVKCYLGHGGLLGLSEGVYTGVPMVLIPMYGDQFHNAAAAANRGAAIVLSFNDLDEKSLRHALDEIFNNTMYVVFFFNCFCRVLKARHFFIRFLFRLRSVCSVT